MLVWGKNLKNGGVVLEYTSSESAQTVKEAIGKDLGKDYSILLPKKVYPKIKIINAAKEVEKDIEVLKKELLNKIT